MPSVLPRSWYLTLGGLYLFLAWAGSAAVTAYQRFGYAFSEPVDGGQLVGDMVSINVAAVARTYFTDPDLQTVNLGLLLTAAAALRLAASSSRHRNKALVSLAILVLPIGLLGFFSLLQTVGRPDGEWLAEGWPMLEVAGPWSIALVILAFASIRRERPTTSGSSGTTAAIGMS